MPQDRDGNEIHEGDVVGARFRVHNVVADSDRLNLVVGHRDLAHGMPDDWRMELSSNQVQIVERAKRPHHAEHVTPADETEQTPPAAPDAGTVHAQAGTTHAGKEQSAAGAIAKSTAEPAAGAAGEAQKTAKHNR